MSLPSNEKIPQKKPKRILNFWDKQSQINAFSIFIGLLAVLGAAFLIGFVSSVRVNYANQFYDLVFTINLLEDLKPGTKVRYQGGLIIGEVYKIKSDSDGHRLYSKIKKDFLLPRKNHRVTVKAWGFFGSKFINITIINPDVNVEMFSPGDIVSIEDIKDSEFLMRKIRDLFIINKTKGESLLEEKLASARQLAKDLSSNKMFNRVEARKQVQGLMNEVIDKLAIFNQIGQVGYEQVSKVNDGTNQKIVEFKNYLPKLKAQVNEASFILNYEKSVERKKMMHLLHDETTYNHINEYMVYIKNLLQEYRENPRKIIFRD